MDRYEGYGRFYDCQELVLDAKLVDPLAIDAKELAWISKKFQSGHDLDALIKEQQRQEAAEKIRAEEVHSLNEECGSPNDEDDDDDDAPVPPTTTRRHLVQDTQRTLDPRDHIPRIELSSNHQIANDVKPQYPRVCEVKALVYLSSEYRTDGVIREEYIARMNNAMIDARKMGVSDEYIRKCIEPIVKATDAAITEESLDNRNSDSAEDGHETGRKSFESDETRSSRSSLDARGSNENRGPIRKGRSVRRILSDKS